MFAAEIARQTSEALSRAARQSRKRADKAEEVVSAAQQTIEISKTLSIANAQLVEAENTLQAAGEISAMGAAAEPSAAARP